MKWYHGTNNKKDILKDGFIANYGRFGEAVYFTSNKQEALNFGKELIEIVNLDYDKLVSIYYPNLINLYPDLAIEEEEGATELIDYVVNELGKDGVMLTYTNGDRELCIYNTDIIAIKV